MLNTNISKALIMLGSNNNAAANISAATTNLWQFGQLIELNSNVATDYTKKTKTLYLNTAVILNLTKTMAAYDIHQHLKNMEINCGRIEHNSPIVALDLDIMAVYIDQWYIIKDRLPFKPHELICMGLDINPDLLFD